MKWVKPFAIGYEYVCIPDKVNNLTALRLLTLSAMKVTNTDNAAINGNHSKCRMTYILSFRKLRNEPNI